MSEAAASIFSVLFPSECRVCSAPLGNISRLPVCGDCLSKIVPIAGPRCAICSQVLPAGYPDPHGDGRCFECAREMPLFTRAASFGTYDGELRELIHLLKYQHVRSAADALGRLVSEAAMPLVPAFADSVVVIPVPLYKHKLRERGFNQAEMVAAAAVRRLSRAHEGKKFEYKSAVLFRRRQTESQVGMTRDERKANLRGAFAVSNKKAVVGRDVLLIDDVLTTGATVGECARVLRKAGAASVWVVTIARAVRHQIFGSTDSHGTEADAQGTMAARGNDL